MDSSCKDKEDAMREHFRNYYFAFALGNIAFWMAVAEVSLSAIGLTNVTEPTVSILVIVGGTLTFAWVIWPDIQKIRRVLPEAQEPVVLELTSAEEGLVTALARHYRNTRAKDAVEYLLVLPNDRCRDRFIAEIAKLESTD